MPRPTWTGSIAFGLVSIPVKLIAATESHRVAFHELEKGTGERIRYRRVAERSGHEVPWDDIQKGFEVAKDRIVVLTDDELATAAPERDSTIAIEQFVPLSEIDPLFWDRSYYASPDGPPAAKAYVLLREAMRKEARVAVGRFVMRTKEYVVCIRPLEEALVLHTMFFADEVRAAKDVVTVSAKVTASAREIAMATQIVSSLASSWDPGAHEDTFKTRVRALVRKKGEGEVIDTSKEGGTGPRITDLMEALKATLAGGVDKRAPATRAAQAQRSRARAGAGRSAPQRRGKRAARRR